MYILALSATTLMQFSDDTYCVVEEEDSTEEAEEICGQQRQVDRCRTGHLYHDGHDAV